jgi:spermidine/putrescine transport system substrate-binding protein
MTSRSRRDSSTTSGGKTICSNRFGKRTSPNLDEVIDYYTEFRSTDYGVPVDGAPCTLIYRNDLDFEPTSWQDFVDHSDLEVGLDAGFWVFPMHAAAIGNDEADLADELYNNSSHERVYDTLREWNVNGWATTGEDIWQQFDSGIIDAAQWYFEQTEYDVRERDDLSHTAPEENTGFVNHWTVVRGTDKRELAEYFLNFLLDPDVQTEWSTNNPGLFCNKNMEYAGGLGEELPRNNEEAQQIAFPDWEYLAEYQSEFSEFFKELQTE